MTIDFTRELKRTFDLASLRREALQNLTGAEWAEYQRLRDSFAAETAQEKQRYRREYETRLEAARARLIDRAGARARHLTHPHQPVDRFDARAIDRQAHRQVYAGHVQALARIEDRQIEAIDALLERAGRRQAMKGRMQKDFSRAVKRKLHQKRCQF